MPHLSISPETLGLIMKVHRTSEMKLKDFIEQIIHHGLTVELMIQAQRCDPKDLEDLPSLVITSKRKFFPLN